MPSAIRFLFREADMELLGPIGMGGAPERLPFRGADKLPDVDAFREPDILLFLGSDLPPLIARFPSTGPLVFGNRWLPGEYSS